MDYSKFKTPYYDIEIGDPTWKNIVKLPESLMRRITKVEVQEAFFTPDHQGNTQLTISFTEGFADDSGLITDLVFDGKQGITSLGEDGKRKKNIAPKFLFQERNKVKITWGYLEDLKNSRSYMGQILQATANFSESGSTSTTITCLPWSWGAADQLSTKKGILFGTRKQLSKGGDSLLVFEDLKTDVLIRKIADELGITHIISENLKNETIDKHKQKMWVAGQSFQQFMTRLAEASGCVYSIELNPHTGKELILFMKKQDFEKRVVISDVNLLYWKQPGSILKSINLNANFGGLSDNAQKGVDEKGEPIESAKDVELSQFTQYKSSATNKKQQIIDPDPTSTNIDKTAVALKDKYNAIAGAVEINPAQNKEDHKDKAELKKDGELKLVTIDFTTIGYTRLTPGIAEINGIGVRYSGKYRIMTVTHTIDNNGYVTKCSAQSQVLNGGGISPENVAKGEEDPKVDIRQFKEQKDPLSQWRKIQGIHYV